MQTIAIIGMVLGSGMFLLWMYKMMSMEQIVIKLKQHEVN